MAYLYVRVRRLNIIIQPNLRFMYELFKWEEQKLANNERDKEVGYLREIDWFIMCREITKLNTHIYEYEKREECEGGGRSSLFSIGMST